MPLQNRVTPFGDLVATPARGLFWAVAAGAFTPMPRRCLRGAGRHGNGSAASDFKGRHRDVWGRFYTELFFFDEPTALAAGHRPCSMPPPRCPGLRRTREGAQSSRAADGRRMDDALHRERLDGRAKRCTGATSTHCRTPLSSRWRGTLSWSAATRC